METLSILRETLASMDKQLLSDVVLFNALHKRAKMLKKKMIVERRDIDEIEARIQVVKKQMGSS